MTCNYQKRQSLRTFKIHAQSKEAYSTAIEDTLPDLGAEIYIPAVINMNTNLIDAVIFTSWLKIALWHSAVLYAEKGKAEIFDLNLLDWRRSQ